MLPFWEVQKRFGPSDCNKDSGRQKGDAEQQAQK